MHVDLENTFAERASQLVYDLLTRVGRLIRVSIIFGDVNRGHPGEGGLASHRARWRWYAHRSELDQLVAHDAVQRGHQGS